MGSRLPRSLATQRQWILDRIEAKPDLTLRELVAELNDRAIAASYGSVWRLLDDEGISFKKKPSRVRTRPARRQKAA
jgi:transposase